MVLYRTTTDPLEHVRFTGAGSSSSRRHVTAGVTRPLASGGVATDGGVRRGAVDGGNTLDTAIRAAREDDGEMSPRGRNSRPSHPLPSRLFLAGRGVRRSAAACGRPAGRGRVLPMTA